MTSRKGLWRPCAEVDITTHDLELVRREIERCMNLLSPKVEAMGKAACWERWAKALSSRW